MVFQREAPPPIRDVIIDVKIPVPSLLASFSPCGCAQDFVVLQARSSRYDTAEATALDLVPAVSSALHARSGYAFAEPEVLAASDV
mmetsp:Transcript_38663/g.52422  ORF Transcript_38663/g.52422 Transcript_38663/m.52422 type:complete len:86 (-) Transcript_38663:606-863(-)